MDEIRFLEPYRFKSASPVLVDVGAHHGYITLEFAKKGWRVLAFEPEVENRARFSENLRGYRGVCCVPSAVSNVSGEKVPFYVSTEHYGIHSLRPWHSTHMPAYEVDTVRLDDILPKHGIEAVTFLKIDIEGADFLALQGFDVDLYRPELIMMEFMDSRTEPAFGYSHHDVVSFMKTRGYDAFVSEWTPVREYAREGVETEPMTDWLRIVPYTRQSNPAWGNLFFVPQAESRRFAKAITAGIHREKARLRLMHLVGKIPGALYSYRLLKSALSALRSR